jgi:hypothetical protein
MSGPIRVVSSMGSPTSQSRVAAATSRSTSSFWRLRWTTSLLPALQFSPMFQKIASRIFGAMWSSGGASAITTWGLLPPSSNTTRLRFVSALWWRKLRPTSVEPVKATTSMSGCRAMATPTTSPLPGTTLRTPAGMPASPPSSAIRRRLRAVWPAGLMTMLLPVARTGPSFQAAIWAG